MLSQQDRMSDIEHPKAFEDTRRGLALLVFFVFVLTFVAARVLVFLIMSHRLPDLYLHIGGTHVHHLNYGIFLLCGVGGYLLFARATGGQLRIVAVLYAIGLALTFDEFGMWLHLGGSYWQRASFDAIAVIGGTLGFVAYFPARQAIQRWTWWQVAVVTAVCIVFFVMLAHSFHHIHQRMEPTLEQMEEKGPK
jgi:hypothetical protein